MSKILDKILKNQEYFSPGGRNEEYVEIWDNETNEYIYMGCHCAFNALVLALKDMHHKGNVAIVHKRDTWSWYDHREEVYYKEYALLSDGFVHMVGKNGGYPCYGEREKA